MKVLLRNIEPNPFRNLKHYKIQKARVQALKNSINETGWWDNILLRPSSQNGNFQLAYGHHRWKALKELNIKEIDVAVKDLDDATMLKIMANENMQDWKASPAAINETVFEVKRFLDAELAKCESWESTNINIRSLFVDERGFRRAKAGVGKATILKFLGHNWKQWMVQDALDVLREQEKEKEAPPEKKETIGTIDRKAYESFDTQSRARKFKQAVRKYNIPKSQQAGLAKKIQRQESGIEEAAYHHAKITQPKKTQKILPPKVLPSLDKFIDDICDSIQTLEGQLIKVMDSIPYIESAATETRFFGGLNSLMKTITKIMQEK